MNSLYDNYNYDNLHDINVRLSIELETKETYKEAKI